MKKHIVLLILSLCLCFIDVDAQSWGYYRPLPPITANNNSSFDVNKRIDEQRKRELEIDILNEKRMLLRNLNQIETTRNQKDMMLDSKATFGLTRRNYADKKGNLIAQWEKLDPISTLTIDTEEGAIKLFMPDINLFSSRKITDYITEKGDGYRTFSYVLEDNDFIILLYTDDEEHPVLFLGNSIREKVSVMESVLKIK